MEYLLLRMYFLIIAIELFAAHSVLIINSG